LSRLFRKIHYVEEAKKLFLDKINEIDLCIENVELEQALGRVLAKDIYSKMNVPPFNRAAMDGFAVVAEDTFGASEDNPIELKIIGESVIGKPFEGKLDHGEAVKIHTGAKIPDGANAVIPVEVTEVRDMQLLVFSSVAPNDNVGKIGEDIKEGDLVLKRGVILQPFDLALLKSIGVTQVPVKCKPIIGVFSCGDELTDDVNEVMEKSGKIIDSNRLMIKTYLKKIGCRVLDYGIVRDNVNELKNVILKAMNETNLLITIGGTSVGEKDYLPLVLDNLGEPGIIIRGITASPGRPLILSIINDFPVISLPGYPVAALIDFLEFAIPIIDKMFGIRGERVLTTVRAKLRKRIPSKPGVRHYVRVRLINVDGELYADPIRITGSGVLSSVVNADGFIVIPEDIEGYEADQLVDVILFRELIGVWNEKDI